jgi:hypothetical protein
VFLHHGLNRLRSVLCIHGCSDVLFVCAFGGCDVFSSCFVHVFNGGLCLLGDVRVSIYDLCDGDSGFGRQV